ncbi:hypothetical protein GCM10022381_32490 [Leifsonia kafniensis]|uniref:TIGR02679 family protein n=1 Tax=Leifsonia kafniensis TaxID=475957 RepID=A0ABP7KV99_9MICO
MNAPVMPHGGDLARLQRLLGTAETAWLLQRLRNRLERQGELRGTVSNAKATTAERVATARLFGRPVRAGQTASVSLETLDDMLRQSGTWPDGLVSAVIALTGDVVGPAARRAESDAWRAATDVLGIVAVGRPELALWVGTVTRTGQLKRATVTASEAQALAEKLVLVAAALPSNGEAIGVLAARLFSDAHALDAKTTLGSLATGLAAALGATGAASADGPAAAGRAQLTAELSAGTAPWRRAAWQSVGVIVDELSSTVLTLGLPGGDVSPTARALHVLAPTDQPAILTLRQLISDGIGAVPPVVFVCENPAVVAAAADQGSRVAMVCLNGQPGAAALQLLRQLVDGGARLRYHGDFDAGGMAIARTLGRQLAWDPWRFSAADYAAACATLTGLSPFMGTVGETPWDPALSDLLTDTRLRVEEESVLDLLLGDLIEHTIPQPSAQSARPPQGARGEDLHSHF